MKKKTIINIFAFLFVFSSILFSFTNKVSAQVNSQGNVVLDGYAWSTNIGWISMSCKTGGPSGEDVCSQSNYGVSMGLDGSLSGYAWSTNIGWVKFDGLSSFPTGGGSVASNAKFDVATGKITGWIRACSGTQDGVCSSMTSRTDGWDGWISLSGSNYGISHDKISGKFSGYAWGSDVVSWVDFSGVTVSTAANPNTKNSLTFTVYRTLSGATAKSDTATIKDTETATIDWKANGLNSCKSFSGPTEDSNWLNSGTQTDLGSKVVSPKKTTFYELHCKDASNADYKPLNVWPTVTVNVTASSQKNSLTFKVYDAKANQSTASSSVSIDKGGSAKLTWSSVGLKNCKSNANPTDSNWTNGGAQSANGSKAVTPAVKTIYELRCKDSANKDFKVGGAWPSVTVDIKKVIDEEPSNSSLIFTVNGSSSASINSGESATLDWSTTNLNSCMSFSNPADANWPNGIGQNENGTKQTSKLTKATVYEIHCKDLDGVDYKEGSAWPTVVVTIRPPESPTVSISANPSSLPLEGGDTTISWTSANSTSCTTSSNPVTTFKGSKTANVTGSESVDMKTAGKNKTTTYTISCNGPSGSATDSVTVVVGGDTDGDGKCDVDCRKNPPIIIEL